jgi:hypothetical protein
VVEQRFLPVPPTPLLVVGKVKLQTDVDAVEAGGDQISIRLTRTPWNCWYAVVEDAPTTKALTKLSAEKFALIDEPQLYRTRLLKQEELS